MKYNFDFYIFSFMQIIIIFKKPQYNFDFEVRTKSFVLLWLGL